MWAEYDFYNQFRARSSSDIAELLCMTWKLHYKLLNFCFWCLVYFAQTYVCVYLSDRIFFFLPDTQLMLDTWNESIFSNIKNRLQDSAMKLVHAERLGEAFDSQLVIGVRESYGTSCTHWSVASYLSKWIFFIQSWQLWW